MTTFLRRTLIVGLCLVPFIPLIVANSLFFPFITGKNFAFRILVEILFAIWAVLILKAPEYRPKLSLKGWPLLVLAIGGLLVSALISVFLAENPSKAFWSNFERMEGWVGLVHAAVYFFLMWVTLNSEKLWRAFWNTSLVVSLIISGYGLLQLAGLIVINQGGVRVDGTFGNATYLAVYMLFHVFLAVSLLVRTWSSSTWLRFFYMFAAVLDAIMIFYSATRGTILGLMGGMFLAGVLMFFLGKGNETMKRWGIASIIVVLVAVGTLFAFRESTFVQNNEVLSRVSTVFQADQFGTRLMIWHMALQGFLERPIFGWGQEGFNYVFNKFYDPKMYNQEPWFDRAHNAFLDWLIAGGAVAFVLYTSFYLLALYYIWRKESDMTVFEKSLFTGLLAAYGFHNLFVFDNLVSFYMFMAVLAYILVRSKAEMPRSSGQMVPDSIFGAASSAIFIVLLVVLYFVNITGIATATNLIQGITSHCVTASGTPAPCSSPGVTQDINANVNYFKEADKQKGLGEQEVKEQFIQFATQLHSMNAGSADFQNQVAQLAATSMANYIKQVPNDARLELFMGSFFRQMGDTTDALPYLERAHELTPGKQQALYELAALKANMGDAQGALSAFKEAYELDRDNQQALAYYAAMLLRVGQKQAAVDLLTQSFGTATPDNDFVLQAYLDVKDYSSALAIAQARVTKDPNNAKLHIQLGAAYLTAGQRSMAVAELQKAIDLDPSFKAQGEYYIQQIQEGKTP